MQRSIQIVLIMMVFVINVTAQLEFSTIAKFNSYNVEPNAWTDANNHIRGIVITDDLDNDGLVEIIATDYSDGGRVHVLEYNNTENLELVWSSPILNSSNPNHTPRWVEFGDLDGDGNKEIIFPSGPKYEGSILIFEYTGLDNDYGTSPVFELPAEQFTSEGLGTFRMDRENGLVADLDGDLKDELITANIDLRGELKYPYNVYILGVTGSFPDSAEWHVEGGRPSDDITNGLSAGSHWQSIQVDYDGDGIKEIVNHHWNFYGFWSIEPSGADQYVYPTSNFQSGDTDGPVYIEYLKHENVDGISYMGINALDIDGDGNEEMCGPIYVGGNSSYNFSVGVIDLAEEDRGVEVWNSNQFGVVAKRLWNKFENVGEDFWGSCGADIDGDGMDEIILGGDVDKRNGVTILDYNGTGSVLDSSNFSSYFYELPKTCIDTIAYYDSLGTIIADTSSGGLISKIKKGDVNNNGKEDLILSYQTVSDSIKELNYSWDIAENKYLLTSVNTIFNYNTVNVLVIEDNSVLMPSKIVGLSIGSDEGEVGDTVEVPVLIEIENGAECSSLQVDIIGNSSTLFTSGICTENTLLEGISWITEYNVLGDTTRIWMAGSTPVASTGPMFKIQYVIKNRDTSQVDLNVVNIVVNTEAKDFAVSPGKVTIKLSEDFGDVDLNGEIQAFDASQILKYLLNLVEFSDQQAFNANVSSDETISTLDASLILQYGTGNVDSLPAITTGQNYLASGEIEFGSQIVSPNAEGILDVPIQLNGFNNIYSFLSTINYDQSIMDFENIIEWNSELNSSLIENSVIDGKIKLVSANTKPISINDQLAVLRFKLKPGIQIAKSEILIDTFNVNENYSIQETITVTIDFTTDIDEDFVNLPEEYRLFDNYPNPFNPSTTIKYGLPEISYVRLVIYNIQGEEILKLGDELKTAGYYNFVFDASKYSSGIYFCVLEAESVESGEKFRQVNKMMLLK